MKAVRLRPAAQADLVAAVQHLEAEAGSRVAERLFNAAMASLEPLQHQPGMGSPRLGLWAEVPGLRTWRVSGFPMQWLYFEAPAHIDVVRLLGDRQDILSILLADDPTPPATPAP